MVSYAAAGFAGGLAGSLAFAAAAVFRAFAKVTGFESLYSFHLSFPLNILYCIIVKSISLFYIVVNKFHYVTCLAVIYAYINLFLSLTEREIMLYYLAILLYGEKRIVDLTILTEEGRLNLRVAGVILDGNKILVEQGDGCPFAVCPGGRINFNETAENAIVREIYEELGVRSQVERLLFIHQNFFDTDGLRNHELCFFFLLNSSLRADGVTLKGRDNKSAYRWVAFDELQNVFFYPLFLKKRLSDLPQHAEPVTEIENGEIK